MANVSFLIVISTVDMWFLADHMNEALVCDLPQSFAKIYFIPFLNHFESPITDSFLRTFFKCDRPTNISNSIFAIAKIKAHGIMLAFPTLSLEFAESARKVDLSSDPAARDSTEPQTSFQNSQRSTKANNNEPYHRSVPGVQSRGSVSSPSRFGTTSSTPQKSFSPFQAQQRTTSQSVYSRQGESFNVDRNRKGGRDWNDTGSSYHNSGKQANSYSHTKPFSTDHGRFEKTPNKTPFKSALASVFNPENSRNQKTPVSHGNMTVFDHFDGKVGLHDVILTSLFIDFELPSHDSFATQPADKHSANSVEPPAPSNYDFDDSDHDNPGDFNHISHANTSSASLARTPISTPVRSGPIASQTTQASHSSALQDSFISSAVHTSPVNPTNASGTNIGANSGKAYDFGDSEDEDAAIFGKQQPSASGSSYDFADSSRGNQVSSRENPKEKIQEVRGMSQIDGHVSAPTQNYDFGDSEDEVSAPPPAPEISIQTKSSSVTGSSGVSHTTPSKAYDFGDSSGDERTAPPTVDTAPPSTSHKSSDAVVSRRSYDFGDSSGDEQVPQEIPSKNPSYNNGDSSRSESALIPKKTPDFARASASDSALKQTSSPKKTYDFGDSSGDENSAGLKCQPREPIRSVPSPVPAPAHKTYDFGESDEETESQRPAAAAVRIDTGVVEPKAKSVSQSSYDFGDSSGDEGKNHFVHSNSNSNSRHHSRDRDRDSGHGKNYNSSRGRGRGASGAGGRGRGGGSQRGGRGRGRGRGGYGYGVDEGGGY
jgi:hypothetical protein